jgi:hypothetical protein
MTNHQVTMTNEIDNDQLTKGKCKTDRLYHFGYCLFIWLLEFGHWPLSSYLVIPILRPRRVSR